MVAFLGTLQENRHPILAFSVLFQYSKEPGVSQAYVVHPRGDLNALVRVSLPKVSHVSC